MMAIVTLLNISLNFSRVRGAKDLSLANLPSKRLEKHSKTQKEQSNRDNTRGYGNPFPTCIISLLQDKIIS